MSLERIRFYLKRRGKTVADVFVVEANGDRYLFIPDVPHDASSLDQYAGFKSWRGELRNIETTNLWTRRRVSSREILWQQTELLRQRLNRFSPFVPLKAVWLSEGGSVNEAKRNIKGKLCVNVGKGSGGGFTNCGALAKQLAKEGKTAKYIKSKTGIDVKKSSTGKKVTPKVASDISSWEAKFRGKPGEKAPTGRSTEKEISHWEKKFKGASARKRLEGKYKLKIIGGEGTGAAERLIDGIEKAGDICKARPPVCAGNLGLSRAEMPQLKEDDSPGITKRFLQSLADDGISVKGEWAHVGELKATQKEIRATKVAGMARSVVAGTFKKITSPIIVSRDGYILDGHHRWATLLSLSPDNRMQVHRVDVDIKDLLKRAHGFEGVTTAGFHEVMEEAKRRYRGKSYPGG